MNNESLKVWIKMSDDTNGAWIYMGSIGFDRMTYSMQSLHDAALHFIKDTNVYRGTGTPPILATCDAFNFAHVWAERF